MSFYASAGNLFVRFLPQYPPGDWTDTLNCGPTSVLMVASKYDGHTPVSNDIDQMDNWLQTNVSGYSINNYNGSATDTTELAMLAQQYFGLNDATAHSAWTEAQLQQELTNGYPVVIAVYTHMLFSGGHRHFMILIGMDSNYVYVNDPGLSNGSGVPYSLSNFRTAWGAQNNSVVVIHPNQPIASGLVTIDFEHYPGPDGILGTADDIPMPTDCNLFGTGSGICAVLTTQYASVGVSFNPDAEVEFLGNGTDPFFNNNHFLSLTPPGITFSIPVYHVSIQSKSVWTATLTAYDSSNNVLATSVLPNPNGIQSGTFVFGTLAVSSSTPIARVTLSGGGSGAILNLDNLVFSSVP